MTAPLKPKTGPLPPGAMSDHERRALVEEGMRKGSLMQRGIISGLALALQIYHAHRDNPLPFLEDELKRQVNL